MKKPPPIKFGFLDELQFRAVREIALTRAQGSREPSSSRFHRDRLHERGTAQPRQPIHRIQGCHLS